MGFQNGVRREGAGERRISRKRGKAKVCTATGTTQMRVYHALLSSPGTRYQDLRADYPEQHADTRRRARDLERLSCKVTIEPLDPATGEMITRARLTAHTIWPTLCAGQPTAQTAAACPAKV